MREESKAKDEKQARQVSANQTLTITSQKTLQVTEKTTFMHDKVVAKSVKFYSDKYQIQKMKIKKKVFTDSKKVTYSTNTI
jgi:alkyl sulfatase BDS1-like metallo-beta-lactamase superfamily hydrolase